MRWSVPLPGPRLLWAPMERRACAFPWRPPRAVLCPAAAFRRSAACIRCRTCAPPTRSLSVDTALWRALGTAGCYTPWSLCQAVLGPPLLPSRSLAGAACLCGPMRRVCIDSRLCLDTSSSLRFAPRGDGGRVSQAR